MANPHNLQVGQELYYVPDDSRYRPSAVAIKKLGRVWATMNRGPRINLETLRGHPEGFLSDGRCYLSKEDYEAAAAADDLWDKLKRNMPWIRPGHIDAETIRKAARVLGVLHNIEGDKR